MATDNYTPPSQKTVPDFDYNKWMALITELSGNTYLKCRFNHIRHLKGDGTAAVLLSFFLNWLYLESHCGNKAMALKQNDMWMKCPAKVIQEQLGMGERRRKRNIEKLQAADLIETGYGQGKTLWVRVRCDVLAKIEEAGKTSAETPKEKERKSGCPTSRNYPVVVSRNNLPEISRNYLVVVSENGVTTNNANSSQIKTEPKNVYKKREEVNLKPNLPLPQKIFTGGKYKKNEGEKDTECMKLAALLREALLKNKRQVLGYTKSWAEVIRLIRDVDKQEITAIVEIYAKHCSKEDQEEYKLPAITKPIDLRRCFSWLEGALKRAGLLQVNSSFTDDSKSQIIRTDNPDGTFTLEYKDEDY